jgi:hypothetical protein
MASSQSSLTSIDPLIAIRRRRSSPPSSNTLPPPP